jgi:hypothetical protein
MAMKLPDAGARAESISEDCKNESPGTLCDSGLKDMHKPIDPAKPLRLLPIQAVVS